jgi:hypothetical protein
LVKVRNNEAFWGNKKYALTLGIKAAKTNIYYLLIAIKFKRLDYSDELAIYDAKTIVLGMEDMRKSLTLFLIS